MCYEIEAKLHVSDHEVIRRRLRDAGGMFVRRGIERNIIYDRRDGALHRLGIGLRIRTVDVEEGEPVQATMTVKGQIAASTFKSREEREIAVDDAENAQHILRMLDFVSVMAYEKRRESWHFQRCQVELDVAPMIGRFVEIEGTDEHAVFQVQKELGLEGESHIPESYIQLLLEYCYAHGIEDRDLRL